MILEMLTVGPFQENCYIIGDEESGTGAVIDPGDEAARIAMAVEQTGLEIGSIIVTHAHIDHVGAVAALVDEYACPVLMHAEAEPMLKQLPTQALMMGLRFGKVPTSTATSTTRRSSRSGISGCARSTRPVTRLGTWLSTSKTKVSSCRATRSSPAAWGGWICRAAAWRF